MNCNSNKSVLDDIQEAPEGFKKFYQTKEESVISAHKKSPLLSLPIGLIIVCACQQCGSPIYGKESIAVNEQPIVRRTCDCFDVPVVNTPT